MNKNLTRALALVLVGVMLFALAATMFVPFV